MRATDKVDANALQHHFLGEGINEMPFLAKAIKVLSKASGDDGFRWIIGVLIDRLIPSLRKIEPATAKRR